MYGNEIFNCTDRSGIWEVSRASSRASCDFLNLRGLCWYLYLFDDLCRSAYWIYEIVNLFAGVYGSKLLIFYTGLIIRTVSIDPLDNDILSFLTSCVDMLNKSCEIVQPSAGVYGNTTSNIPHRFSNNNRRLRVLSRWSNAPLSRHLAPEHE